MHVGLSSLKRACIRDYANGEQEPVVIFKGEAENKSHWRYLRNVTRLLRTHLPRTIVSLSPKVSRLNRQSSDRLRIIKVNDRAYS